MHRSTSAARAGKYRDWRDGAFYPPRCPQRRWLEHYATLFDTVEVNSTFYRLAKPEAVARWVAETPPDFVFTVKASRYLTHMRRLTDIDAAASARFYEAIAPLADVAQARPGAVAAARRTSSATRTAWPTRWSSLPPGRHCFEFRHESLVHRRRPRDPARATAPRSSTATIPSGRGSRSS